MTFGATPLDGSSTPLPMSSVVPDGTGTPVALEGGPTYSSDASGNKAPASMYVKDGNDVTLGISTDANTVNSVMGRLTKIRDLLNSSIAVTGTFWQATQPISAASLPLPTGASTSAKQPALGTAGTASSDVLTVQGITSMTALKVDGSGVTQPVSGTFWQTTQPVSGTFWQATQPVSGTVTANAGTGPFPTAGMVASGASNANNPIKIGGVFNTTQPTVTNGQIVDSQYSARGAQIVATGTDTFNATINAALPAGTNVIGHVIADSGSTTAVTGTVAVTESGTWTVQPGNTPNTTPWLASSHDGTTLAKNVSSTGTGANAASRLVAGAYQEIAGAAAGSVTGTSTDLVASTDMSAYSFFALQMTGTWTMTLQAQWSNDNANFTAGEINGISGAGSLGTSITANGMYILPKMGRYLRIRPSAWTSNASGVGTLECYTIAPANFVSLVAATQSGTWNGIGVSPGTDVTMIASAAFTTTQTGADQTNTSGRGVRVVLDMTTVGTGSVTLEIDAKDVASGKYVAQLTGAAVTSNSTNVYVVYPGIPVVANSTASDVIPKTWRIKVTANNANSATYSVGYSYLS